MRKRWLITATALVLAGVLLFGGVMTVLKWDFTKLSTTKTEVNEHTVDTAYKNVSILDDTADITFLPSANADTTVVCEEREKQQHTVTVEDGTLTVKGADTRRWYEYIGIGFGTPKITVYMPAGAYEALSIRSSTGDVNIPKHFTFQSMDIRLSTGSVTNRAAVSGSAKLTTSTGDIRVENTSADSLELTASTGKVSLSHVTCTGAVTVGVSTGKATVEDVKCNAFTTAGNTGNVVLKNVLVSGKLSVERSTGDVRFDGCDAAEIYVKTDTGHVRGSLLTPKIFTAQSDTGHVDVPKSAAGGVCEVKTDTGDILLTVE